MLSQSSENEPSPKDTHVLSYRPAHLTFQVQLAANQIRLKQCFLSPKTHIFQWQEVLSRTLRQKLKPTQRIFSRASQWLSHSLPQQKHKLKQVLKPSRTYWSKGTSNGLRNKLFPHLFSSSLPGLFYTMKNARSQGRKQGGRDNDRNWTLIWIKPSNLKYFDFRFHRRLFIVEAGSTFCSRNSWTAHLNTNSALITNSYFSTNMFLLHRFEERYQPLNYTASYANSRCAATTSTASCLPEHRKLQKRSLQVLFCR